MNRGQSTLVGTHGNNNFESGPGAGTINPDRHTAWQAAGMTTTSWDVQP